MNNIKIIEEYIEALREPKPFKYTNEEKARLLEGLLQENKKLNEILEKLYSKEFIQFKIKDIVQSKIQELEDKQEQNRKDLYNAVNNFNFKQIDILSEKIIFNMNLEDYLKKEFLEEGE